MGKLGFAVDISYLSGNTLGTFDERPCLRDEDSYLNLTGEGFRPSPVETILNKSATVTGDTSRI